jgi:uncharacterized RDD family membrane protein YckC
MTDPEPLPIPITHDGPAIAGFWRRFLAFAIDGAILSIPAFCLGLLFFAQFARLGGWGRLIGFLVALMYFGLMNSAIANGQTLGKRIMKIRVVGLDGLTISLPRSLTRYLILGAPFFLNGAAIPPRVFNTWIGIVIEVIIFGVGASIIYLFIFNRRNRRSLHDALVSTYVIKAKATAALNLGVWLGHYVIVSLVMVIWIFTPLFFKGFLERSGYKELLALQGSLWDQPNVWYVAVFSGKGFAADASGVKSSSTTSVGVWIDRSAEDYDALANRFAKITFDTFPNAERSDRLILNITYGYDIGLSTTHISHGFDYSPSEWHTRINAR